MSYIIPPEPFTADALAARLTEASNAHHAYVESLRADYARVIDWSTDAIFARDWEAERDAVIAKENADWATWYATYLAPRLNADLRARAWSPDPVSQFPPYAPVGQADGYSDDVGAMAPDRVGLSRWANVRPLAAYGRVGVDNDNAAE